jgi:DnaJ-class molecular chaperone
MDNLCEICNMEFGREVKISKDNFFPTLKEDKIYNVCDECIEKCECPRCQGIGNSVAKQGTKPPETLVCDLCRGTGKFDYNS